MSADSAVPIPRPERAALGLSPARLDPDSPLPLYRQVYEALRRDILAGDLESGQRLASTRGMAQELGVSRNTVLEAVEQLSSEGYLVGRVGSGTFVAEDLPEKMLSVTQTTRLSITGDLPRISTRGQLYKGWASQARRERGRPFQLGRPALDAFPWEIWSRLLNRRVKTSPREWLDYSDSAGYGPLREALARYLRASRGLSCEAEQIVVVRGSQQGLDLAARVLLEEGELAWVEDPGYPAARIAFAAGGAQVIPVPVDNDGLQVEAGRSLGPEARLAYVTPSHQFPLGKTLSLNRRLELLSWAREAGAWIVEDDYDSEYRFAGRPLASLAGLDGGRHVIYLGTLSKVLFPALRVGYLVVPRELVDAFLGARFAADRHTPLLEQAVVADFFDEGHFGRHIRRMRLLYAERQQALRAAVEEYLGDEIDLESSGGGLHDVGWLKHRTNEREIAARAAAAGVAVAPISSYSWGEGHRPGLLFGYAGFPVEETVEAVKALATVLRRKEWAR